MTETDVAYKAKIIYDLVLHTKKKKKNCQPLLRRTVTVQVPQPTSSKELPNFDMICDKAEYYTTIKERDIAVSYTTSKLSGFINVPLFV